MCDVDTQQILDDIRVATQAGESNSLFLLYIATPGGAPGKLHSSLIQPFLKLRGWQKVNYRKTGFRALYFLHDKEEELDDQDDDSWKCSRCKFSKDDLTIFQTPRKKKKLNESELGEKLNQSLHHNCSFCVPMEPSQRASRDRSDLKHEITKFKNLTNKTFDVHIVLSRPVDYEEDFLEFASQPDAIEQ